MQDTGFDPIEGTDKKDKNKDNIHHLAKKYWSAVATDPFSRLQIRQKKSSIAK